MTALPPQIQSELDTLKNIIVDTVPVERIYLFGSYAHGTSHQDSDLDLYVVLKDDAPIPDIDAAVKIWSAVGDRKTMPADILVSHKTPFKYRLSAPTMEQEVAEKGIKIYG